MRPHRDVRTAGALAALGALGIGSYVTVGPLAAHAAGSDAGVLADGSPGPIQVAYGQSATIRGRLLGGQPGQRLELEFEPAGSAVWTSVAATNTGSDGTYRLSARLERSGELRVALGDTPVGDATASSAGATTQPKLVYVGAGIAARAVPQNVLLGRAVVVRGAVSSPQQGRVVTLQERHGRRWLALARTRTAAGGRYTLRFTPHALGSLPLRVQFGGDQVNAAAHRRIAAVNVYHLAGASWYGPGGTTACGEALTSSTPGVANKTLPCGTIVTLHLGNRTVRAPVIDRGPYVAGREYDLTPATKAALGFGDTGEVWATA
jgi:hypothetical protein